MMEDLRAVMHEETENFLKMLGKRRIIRLNKLSSHQVSCQHILAVCRKHHVDLVICGNHNHSFARILLGKSVVSASRRCVVGTAMGDQSPRYFRPA